MFGDFKMYKYFNVWFSKKFKRDDETYTIWHYVLTVRTLSL